MCFVLVVGAAARVGAMSVCVEWERLGAGVEWGRCRRWCSVAGCGRATARGEIPFDIRCHRARAGAAIEQGGARQVGRGSAFAPAAAPRRAVHIGGRGPYCVAPPFGQSRAQWPGWPQWRHLPLPKKGAVLPGWCWQVAVTRKGRKAQE